MRDLTGYLTTLLTRYGHNNLLEVMIKKMFGSC
jgi:hypothetical protein